jgi:hypothetical protein
MDRHLDDIRRYIRLSESAPDAHGDDFLLEDIQITEDHVSNVLLEDVSDVIFRLRSYGETDSSPEYSRGVEEGLALAANMLEGLLNRYSKPSIR